MRQFTLLTCLLLMLNVLPLTANADADPRYALPVDMDFACYEPNPACFTETGYEDASLTVRTERRIIDGVIYDFVENRDFFDWGSDEDLATYTSPLLLPDAFEYTSSPSLDWEWSMARYENALSTQIEQGDQNVREAWDELEKSVVSHVADEVKVSIRSGTVEMIIYKKLG